MEKEAEKPMSLANLNHDSCDGRARVSRERRPKLGGGNRATVQINDFPGGPGVKIHSEMQGRAGSDPALERVHTLWSSDARAPYSLYSATIGRHCS